MIDLARLVRIPPIALILVLVSCSPAVKKTEYRPQSGDLLFQITPRSGFSEAIVQATAQGDSLRFSHVAIVALEDGKPYVLEASSRGGVARTEWTEFMERSQKINGRPGVVAMRVVSEGFPLAQAVARAQSHIGEEYDWWFYPDNGKMYCSELVYESYRLPDGSPLFSAKPMNFRDADGNMPAFWTELFARLGEPVPEGVPGTNPGDMAKDSSLVEVWRWF